MDDKIMDKIKQESVFLVLSKFHSIMGKVKSLGGASPGKIEELKIKLQQLLQTMDVEKDDWPQVLVGEKCLLCNKELRKHSFGSTLISINEFTIRQEDDVDDCMYFLEDLNTPARYICLTCGNQYCWDCCVDIRNKKNAYCPDCKTRIRLG